MTSSVTPEPAPDNRDLAGLGEPMRSRWSPTIFDTRHLLTSQEIVLLLQAAQWAPSWGNSQPWHYLVAERGSSTADALTQTLTRGNRSWVPRASVVLVSVVQVEPVGDLEPSPMALYDAGQAAAHLTLQARSMGLDAHQFAGFDRDAFGVAMGVPGTHRVLPGIAVGRVLPSAEVAAAVASGEVDERLPDKQRRARVRRDLADFTFAPVWGQVWPGASGWAHEHPE